MIDADAIVLAGGAARRLGGVDKPGLMVGRDSMLTTALTAVAACARVAVVGPHRPELDAAITQVREDPPGSGPVAAIDAALRALGVGAPLVVVLAADLPFLSAWTVTELRRHSVESGADAVIARDENGHTQYLVGVWRRTALDGAIAALDSVLDQPMKALLPTVYRTVTVPGTDDCDTETALARARAATEPGPDSVNGAALSLDEARNMLRIGLSRLPSKSVRLRDAMGAVLAEPVHAAEALPRFDVSAMDGYAVAGTGPWRLRRDVVFAGGPRPAPLAEGEAVRIATGAQVLPGAIRVLRDEFAAVDDTAAAGKLLTHIPETPVREDVRRKGEDLTVGDRLAAPGTTVGTALISAAAGVEIDTAVVRGPLRARIVMTGDEIRTEGALHDSQIRDTIGPILPTVLSAYGIETVAHCHVRDTAVGFDEILATTELFDLLIVVGATGGGAADQLRPALTRARTKVLVPRLSMRPGGSTIVGELPDDTTVLGLPGNPFAAVATLMTLCPTIFEARTGHLPTRPIRGPLRNATALSGPIPRIAAVENAATGGWIGDPHTRTAHLGGLLDRDGLVVVPAHAADDAIVEFLPLPM